MVIHPVVSSNVVAIAWADNTLYIHFHNGRTYAYLDVPEQTATNMVAAESVGKFFHANVKNSYAWTELDRVGEIACLFGEGLAQAV